MADVLSGKLSKELVKDLLVLLFSDREALVPSSFLSENLKARKVTTLNNLRNLVAGDIRLLLALVNLLDEDLLHFHWADLLSTLHGSIPFLDLKVGINSFVVHKARFEDLSSRLKLLDVEKTVSKDVDNIVKFVLGEIHSQVERVVPNLLKLFFALEHLLRDFEVSVDSLSILALLFPNLSTVEDLLSRLGLNATTT